ncbi:MAG: AmmeMemoRadiSam system protein B [Nitrospiraceae bacterium]|nr:AmmeMemoRadiSam system protein B [Nitrospiraceae bacterium]
MTTRTAAAAGQFYPSALDALSAQLDSFLTDEKKEKVIAAICPHAGYVYSGAVAGAVYSRLEIPKKVILLGPNHTGYGPQFSVMTEGAWEVPNGTLQVDTGLAEKIIKEVPFFTRDAAAHVYEHSLEVQIPFIARLRPDASIVPITMMPAMLDYLEKAGNAIASAIMEEDEEVLIIVSSDMSHYLPDSTTRKKDSLAIEKILALDPRGLLDTVTENMISMCGYIPAITMLYAAKMLGAGIGELVRYDTSASASGDYEQVVGYAGIIIK